MYTLVQLKAYAHIFKSKMRIWYLNNGSLCTCAWYWITICKMIVLCEQNLKKKCLFDIWIMDGYWITICKMIVSCERNLKKMLIWYLNYGCLCIYVPDIELPFVKWLCHVNKIWKKKWINKQYIADIMML